MTVRRLGRRVGQRGDASRSLVLFHLGALIAAVIFFAVAEKPAHAEGAPKLLLLPIVVHSSEDPEYLRDGLSDMLAARFDRIGAIDLVRSPPTSRGATNLEDALKLARKAGVDYVLYGSFTRFGKGASLDVQCSPVSGDKDREPLREIFVHSGSIGEIIPDLDELAGKVSRFALGEDVTSPAAPGGGPGPGAAGASSRAIQALTDRVESLEATVREWLEREAEAGTDG